MLSLRADYADAAELRRALDQEITRGVLLVKCAPPEGLGFRDVIAVEIATPGGTVAVEAEVVSILPGVGVAVAFPAARTADVRALLGALSVAEAMAAEEAPAEEPPAEAPSAARSSNAEKIQQALHGTREERATILRDQNRGLHAFVLKSPQVTVDEVTAWAKNAQMHPDFLKQIGDRKEWLSRPAIAQALVKNPKTPPDLAVRALDHVPMELLRQWAKGTGAAPHIVQAARRKVIGK
jgi:hypothetical protein